MVENAIVRELQKPFSFLMSIVSKLHRSPDKVSYMEAGKL